MTEILTEEGKLLCGFKSPIDYEREYRAGPTMGLAA